MQHHSFHRAALAGVSLAVAFAVAGCGSSGGSAVPVTSDGAPSSNPGAAVNNADVMFLRMMIPHHQQAVEMATLAQTRAGDPQVKQLAARIKTEQTAEIATMKTWLTRWGQPTTMPSDHHDLCPMPSGDGMMPSMPGGMMPCGPSGMMPSGMPSMPGMMSSADMAKLQAATGSAFDQQFLQMMIAHHQGAIQMAHAEQTYGSNPDVKALAGSVIRDQQAEIATMQTMLTRK